MDSLKITPMFSRVRFLESIESVCYVHIQRASIFGICSIFLRLKTRQTYPRIKSRLPPQAMVMVLDWRTSSLLHFVQPFQGNFHYLAGLDVAFFLGYLQALLPGLPRCIKISSLLLCLAK